MKNKKTKKENHEVKNMSTINVKKFGLAVGSTFALLYIACVVVVMTAGREGVIFIFNTLFHGLDVTSLNRSGRDIHNRMAYRSNNSEYIQFQLEGRWQRKLKMDYGKVKNACLHTKKKNLLRNVKNYWTKHNACNLEITKHSVKL